MLAESSYLATCGAVTVGYASLSCLIGAYEHPGLLPFKKSLQLCILDLPNKQTSDDKFFSRQCFQHARGVMMPYGGFFRSFFLCSRIARWSFS